MSLYRYASNLASWANQLNGNPEWTKSLESAFDQIGFTTDYIAAASKRKKFHRRKVLKDNVWGMVEIDPVCAWLLDSPLLQRLRSVKQLGLTYLTYPGAQHSRFEHSLGVLYVVNRLLNAFERNETNEKVVAESANLKAVSYPEDGYETTVVRLAALLHDVGHIPFSHATEGYFVQAKAITSVGSFVTEEFLNEFNLNYFGLGENGDRVTAARDNKSLSEIFSVAIVLSSRFRDFLDKCCPYPFNSRSTNDVTCDIAALILGDPIAENDRALPQLISGPVDADKVDYMLRDAHACGLELGIDVSRLFFRASVYEVKNRDAITEYVAAPIIRDASPPFKVFLLDQSGTDSALEMGFARLSLYSRVYYHQLTRNAESHLHALMDLAGSVSPQAKAWSEFCHVWAHSDQSLLYCLSRDDDPQVRQTARSILERRLLKRGGCCSIDLFQPSALGEVLPLDKLVEALENLHMESYSNLTRLLSDKKYRDDFLQKIRLLCKEFRSELLRHKESPESLPEDDEPEFIRFILPPGQERALVPQALILTSSHEISQQRQRESSYVDAGRLVAQRSYLLVPRAWRELALLALQKAIFECDDLTVKSDASSDSESGGRYRALYRLVLMGDASANESKINWRQARSYQVKLSDLYAGAEVLIENDSNLLHDLAKNAPGLSQFDGQSGWSLKTGSDLDSAKVGAFLRQFPYSLRRDAVKLICNLTVLSRVNTSELLVSALQSHLVNVRSKVTLVPLTPSSGEQLRTYMKDHVGQGAMKNCVLASSLEDALADTSRPESIFFIDDNISSGTQCINQLSYWMGIAQGSRPSSANYFKAQLEAEKLSALKEIPLGFAFAVGNDATKDSLIERMTGFSAQQGLRLVDNPLMFGVGSSKYSGKEGSQTAISSELREFLRRVGRDVIRHQVEIDDRYKTEGARIAECENRALGYTNEEGLLFTSLNVPSSTYTALWCPGTYRVNNKEMPWLPLLVRTGQLQHMVIF